MTKHIKENFNLSSCKRYTRRKLVTRGPIKSFPISDITTYCQSLDIKINCSNLE